MNVILSNFGYKEDIINLVLRYTNLIGEDSQHILEQSKNYMDILCISNEVAMYREKYPDQYQYIDNVTLDRDMYNYIIDMINYSDAKYYPKLTCFNNSNNYSNGSNIL